MFFNRYFTPMVVLIVVIAISHALALSQYYYWDIWWFDVIMHFLGGFWIGLFFFWIVSWLGLPVQTTLRNMLVLILTIAILWEVWELVSKITFWGKDGYFTDTLSDIFMGTLGAMSSYVVFKKHE